VLFLFLADIFSEMLLEVLGNFVKTKYFYWAAARERKWR